MNLTITEFLEILSTEKPVVVIKYEGFEPKDISKELLEVINALPTLTYSTISKVSFATFFNTIPQSDNTPFLLFKKNRDILLSLVDADIKRIDNYIKEIEDNTEFKEYILSVNKVLNNEDCNKALHREIDYKDIATDVIVYVKNKEEATRFDLIGKLKRDSIKVIISEIPTVTEYMDNRNNNNNLDSNVIPGFVSAGDIVGEVNTWGTSGAVLPFKNKMCMVTCGHGFVHCKNLYCPNKSQDIKITQNVRFILLLIVIFEAGVCMC